jgi:O-antigen/teichoic acid export membrane protein
MYVMFRELMMKQMFIADLVYFGTMSGIIFYCAGAGRFLTYTDMIDITYLGSFLSTIVSIALTRKFWKFRLKGTTRYKDILKFSGKYSIIGISLTLPRTLDVYAIQYFFGTGVVGLYAPAKTIFRFVEDAMNTVFATIYSPTVRYFANNDIESVNKLISKAISLLIFGFTAATICCWLGGENVFSLFLPQKFIAAIPFFNILMLSSIVLPFSILNTTISAEGKPGLVAVFIACAMCMWLLSFVLVGTYFADKVILAAAPCIVFNLVLAIFFYIYAKKHYQLRPKQLLRAIPDGINFIKSKI